MRLALHPKGIRINYNILPCSRGVFLTESLSSGVSGLIRSHQDGRQFDFKPQTFKRLKKHFPRSAVKTQLKLFGFVLYYYAKICNTKISSQWQFNNSISNLLKTSFGASIEYLLIKNFMLLFCSVHHITERSSKATSSCKGACRTLCPFP